MVVEEILFDKLILNYKDAKLQNFANATEWRVFRRALDISLDKFWGSFV